MINSGLVTENFGEPLHVIPAPSFVHFAIAPEFAAHQVMFALYPRDGEPVRLQGDKYFSADRGLAVPQELFDIANRGVQHLPLMQPVAVPIAQLILPIKLPL